MATRQSRLEAMPRPAVEPEPVMKQAAPVAPVLAASVDNDLEQEIRIRAYEIFEQRGGEPGRELEDWLQAEAEVLARHGRSGAAA